MEVPFRLTRRDAPLAADAVLVLADGFAPVAAAVVALGAEPAVFPVRGGFLLVPGGAVPGAIRLRRLAGDLFIPADADLIPALLPEEAAGLTRDRGLVFLPGGAVLAFDPATPLPTSRWVAPRVVRRAEWEPLPEPPPRAERLTAIEGPPTVADVLNIGRPDGADPLPGSGAVPEDARPPSGSAADRAAGAAKLGAGKFLNWLGSLAGFQGLAKFGADLARKAIEQVPRLSEKVLGAQEAALREVLRQLQSADAEAALRRAPPAFSDPATPARVGTDANLGTRDPRYDLRSLIGGTGGAAVGWLGGGDVWVRLADEYRRLAREATARGDFRRAAYLLGVLLRDVRAAANALLAGGLFRDAAVLLRDKLNDDAAAAAAFEKAGEYDEAVRLYERAGRFETAGDLLRRLGDEPAARAYYLRAASALVERNEWLAAGDLVRAKVGHVGLAETYFRRGWDTDGVLAIACGLRLLDDWRSAGDWAAAEALFDDAEARYAPPRTADAAMFFQHARDVASRFPADRADALADRTRLLFARHLADRGTAEVSRLFGRWPAPVARDAAVAARARPRAAAHDAPMRIVAGPVHAVVVAPNSRDIVIAAEGGLVRWQRDGTRTVFATGPGDRLMGLAVSADGVLVVDLRASRTEPVARCYTAGIEVACRGLSELVDAEAKNPHAGWYLEPVVGTDGGTVGVTVATPRFRQQLSGTYLATTSAHRYPPSGGLTHLLIREGRDIWVWHDRLLDLLDVASPPRLKCCWAPHWTPAVPPGSSLVVPRTDWLTPSPGVIEVAGVDRDGGVHWFRFDARDPKNTAADTADTAGVVFTAAALVGPGQVVAASDANVIQWMSRDGTKLRPRATVALRVPSRVVALVGRGANEVIAVLADGTTVRVSPGRS